MNIKILDRWLREYLKTKATPKKIAEVLSLTSVSVERMEKTENDVVYDIEVTTNRPDLMSIIGLAREAATALLQFGIEAEFIPLETKPEKATNNFPINIKNDPKLVTRICAVVMSVIIKDSPDYIKQRLETSGIRSLNNIIDVTNYIMRETGHPAHVFDFDRLNTKEFIVRESKNGEKIVTLDKKEHILKGGDIVADNGKGEIVDLLGVMGTANSVVHADTKRIMLFIDNNKTDRIRKTSMSLGIRTEAAVLNEKNIDPELSMQTLLRGIELYKEVANGKVENGILDIYPNKPKSKSITVSHEKIDSYIGVPISLETVKKILVSLGFKTEIDKNKATAVVPSWRAADVNIAEDIIEEIARIYGYHKLPTVIPPLTKVETYEIEKDRFYWEKRTKDAMRYFGFTEVYTSSLVSEELLEGPTENAVELANPLNEDLVYMRTSLAPSLINVIRENKTRNNINIFEISNIYKKVSNNLPEEIPMFSAVFKKEKISFYEVKGVIEQILTDLGIENLIFKSKESGGEGADVFINKDFLGSIEILDDEIADFELNFLTMLRYATLKKIFTPIPKYPSVIEDVRIIIDPSIAYKTIIDTIKKQAEIVSDVSLLDIFEDKKTFRITYRDKNKTLTDNDVSKLRSKIYSALEKELKATIA